MRMDKIDANIETMVDRIDTTRLTETEDDKVRSTMNKTYAPKYSELHLLRDSDEPYVDVDKDGMEYTANTGGEWDKCLKLSEILNHFSPNPVEAWTELGNTIRNSPGLVLRWVELVAPPGQMKGPRNFRFGSRKNFDRVKFILETAYPHIKIQNPHRSLQHRGGKKKVTSKKPY